MRLSREEESFLRHWMYDEVHYANGPGTAKRLQVQRRVAPAELALLIAAAFPEPGEQQAAGLGPPPPETPSWPWSEAAFQDRVREARTTLSETRRGQTSGAGAAPE